MRSRRPGEGPAGFSLLELIIVVAIVGILAGAAVPLAKWGEKRSRELELRRSLRQMRDAIDAYHAAAVAGQIRVQAEDEGYPESLEALVEGVERVDPGTESQEDLPDRVKFLRRIPVDPMTGEADWGMRCYEDPPDSRFWCRDNVFDVFSKSRGEAIDGTRYRDW